MLLKTYQKIINLFAQHHGYMSFEELKYNGVTVLQMRELENEGILQHFARGWYWCTECGIRKPKDYKYIEIAKINQNAVICLDSACYLNGILPEEPDILRVATGRNDRKKMEINFPVERHFFSNMGMAEEVITKNTEFGTYKYFGKERALCDCMRMSEKINVQSMFIIEREYRNAQKEIARYKAYIREYKQMK